MKIQLVQFHPEINEEDQKAGKEANLVRILDHVDKGLAAGANLIAFGEQALVGYDLAGKVKYADLAEPIPGPVTEQIQAKLKGKNCMVLLGMPENDLGEIYNSTPLIGPDGVIGTARKLYLANFQSILTGATYQEGVWFKPGQRITICDTPFGRIGIEICLDAYHPEITYAHAVAGCWLILQPSATPFIVVGAAHPSPLQLGRGFECIACMAYVNIVGDQVGQPYNGGSCMIMGPAGAKAVASVGKEAKEETIEFEVEPNDIYNGRARFPMLRDARPDLMKQLWEITEKARSG
ncbi:carbon-nitrogen hydrolase family protein [Chloroflexota bacterium]